MRITIDLENLMVCRKCGTCFDYTVAEKEKEGYSPKVTCPVCKEKNYSPEDDYD